MADLPRRTDLLAAARRTLLDEVSPHVAEPGRLAALMVANAMAIAAREGDAAPATIEVSPAAIRAGRHDDDGTLYAALLADARARTAIANPKELEGD